jgi:hypothetical protein
MSEMRRIDYVWSFFLAFQIVAFATLLILNGADNLATWVYTSCAFGTFVFILVLDRFHVIEELNEPYPITELGSLHKGDGDGK